MPGDRETESARYVGQQLHPNISGAKLMEDRDPWVNRSKGMRCQTCVFYVRKEPSIPVVTSLGRCRRHAPTMNGYPVVFPSDWCGDHKLDEDKV